MPVVKIAEKTLRSLMEVLEGVEHQPDSKSKTTVLCALGEALRKEVKRQHTDRRALPQYNSLCEEASEAWKEKLALQEREDTIADIKSLGAGIQTAIIDYASEDTATTGTIATAKRKYDDLEAKAEELLHMIKKSKPN